MVACNLRAVAIVPAANLEREKKFYHETLGLRIIDERPEEILFEGADGSRLVVYRKTSISDRGHTEAGYEVEDLESCVESLRREGVKFEQYDLPELKTDDRGIARTDGMKTAWFKDPEGNIVALTEMREMRR